ncbi:MAG: hypothetical protein L6V93_05420 [Clostridiales bacterium]|nr:MAG: hypothetical protein L6V93_05420 [Clostridiales bacterium]
MSEKLWLKKTAAAETILPACRRERCTVRARIRNVWKNLRVFLTASGQNLVNNAVNVKCRKVEIVWIYTDVEPVAFNRGYYTVDLKFFFRVSLDVYCGVCKPTPIEGLATYDKKSFCSARREMQKFSRRSTEKTT